MFSRAQRWMVCMRPGRVSWVISRPFSQAVGVAEIRESLVQLVPEKAVHFVVIGCPGSGKSTFINQLAKRKVVKVSPGKESTTQIQDDNVQCFSVQDADTEFSVTVVDTPSFPATDKTTVVPSFDYVIDRCNEKINGVLLVVRQDREVADLMKRYRVMLREFIHLQPPLMLLVNGTENPGEDRNDVDFQNHREESIQKLEDFGKAVEAAAALRIHQIFVSYEKSELYDIGKQIVRVLHATQPQTSQLTRASSAIDQMKADLRDAEAAERKKINAQILVLEQNVDFLEKRLIFNLSIADGMHCGVIMAWVALVWLDFSLVFPAGCLFCALVRPTLLDNAHHFALSIELLEDKIVELKKIRDNDSLRAQSLTQPQPEVREFVEYVDL